MGWAGLTENPAGAVDRAALGEDQNIVDDLVVHKRVWEITDDDARPPIGCCAERRTLTVVQPPEKRTSIVKGEAVAATTFARRASARAS